MHPALNQTARALRDLLFPPVCLNCGGLCESGSEGVGEGALQHICARCAPLVVAVRAPHCETCGHPFFGVVEGERMCPHCEGLRPRFGRAKTVTLFKGPARELVLTLKYRRGTFVLDDLATLIRANREVTAFLAGAVLVPVPLHPRKQRERGYNQSQHLAEVFAREAGRGARVAELLERVEDGESQTTFDRQTRRQRMKNAFAARKCACITPEQRYILVDDVFTTGSTLNACARALRRAGALTIDVVTFAHG